MLLFQNGSVPFVCVNCFCEKGPPRQNIFWLGATPQFLAGGAKPPPDPRLKRSFVTFDRGGQTGPPRSNDFFFGAADDTRAADDRPAGRPAEFLGFRVFGTVIGPLRNLHPTKIHRNPLEKLGQLRQ